MNAHSDTIERVARALCLEDDANPDMTLGGDGENFWWHEYVTKAEAAIEAMDETPDGETMASLRKRIAELEKAPVWFP